MPAAAKPAATLSELQAEPNDDKLHALRHVFPAVVKLAAGNSDLAAWQVLKDAQIDLAPFDDFILAPKFNTTYEELHCVGLDRDQSLLHGIVQVKRASGYSGGLCTAGSREYIAFYLDFGAGWEYQGTTNVVVHDVPVPRGGLWYQASLPVNLDEHRMKWCETGRARIRGILSWAMPPAPNQPEFIPHWGDREDCWIEIRPWPAGVEPGVPFLEAIGNMPVAQIAATGYANGGSIGSTFTADDSPFGGAILIAGFLAMPSSSNLEYRVMVKAPSDPVFKPWTKTFNASVTTIIGTTITHSNVSQVATGDWFTYLPEAGPPVFISVAGNLLARFTASEEGLHRVFVQFRDPAVPMVVMSTAIHNFLVDNTPPVVDVEITSGAGNCSKFAVDGEPIVGTFSMSDAHSHSLTLTVTPHPESDPGNLIITAAVPPGPLLALPKFGPGATQRPQLRRLHPRHLGGQRHLGAHHHRHGALRLQHPHRRRRPHHRQQRLHRLARRRHRGLLPRIARGPGRPAAGRPTPRCIRRHALRATATRAGLTTPGARMSAMVATTAILRYALIRLYVECYS